MISNLKPWKHPVIVSSMVCLRSVKLLISIIFSREVTVEEIYLQLMVYYIKCSKGLYS
jgi:hypothetical protein